MADENTIGLYVKLYTENFEANKRRIDSMISSLEGNLGSLEQKQKAAAQAAKAQADAQKKAVAAAEKAARTQEAAVNKATTAVRNFAIATAIVSAAVIKGYQAMRDAATELGDTEAIAQFEAMDAAIAGLRDTMLQSGLEMLKIVGAVEIVSSSLAWMQDIVAKSAAGWAGMLTLVQNVFQVAQGIANRTGPVTIDTKAIVNNARIATAQVYAELSNVPKRKTPEEKKQLDKNIKDIESYNQKVVDLQIKSGESILDAEKDFHDKSASAWQSYMDEVAGITEKGIQKRAELSRDYSDDITDAETDYQRGIEDASYQHGQKLADIERDYQDNIRNIQDTYQTDALEAVRNLDAIGLIRAREKRDKDLAIAERGRDEANASESENYSRQLAELQRSLEDKKREAEVAYQRGLEEQRRAEQEALQSAKDTLNQQNADAAKTRADKLAAIKRSYNSENIAAQAQYGYAEEAFRAYLQRMQSIMAQYGMTVPGITAPTGALPRRERASGGLDIVNSPTQFLVGEDGPEMVYTEPLGRSVPMPVTQTVNHAGNFSHSIDAAISSSVAGLDGRITAVVRKAIAEVLR